SSIALSSPSCHAPYPSPRSLLRSTTGAMRLVCSWRQLLQDGVEVEVVVPARDAVVADDEDAGHGQLGPAPVLQETVGPLVHDDVAVGDLVVDDHLEALARGEQHLERVLHALRAVDRWEW